MKMTSRFVLVGAVVGTTLVASNASAALRFFYGYGDAVTVNYQTHNWNGVVANAAAAVGSEVPSGAMIRVPKTGDNVAISLQVWVENTGSDVYVNGVSVFNAFSSGAASSATIWRSNSAAGAIGTAADTAAYTTALTVGGTNPGHITASNTGGSYNNWNTGIGSRQWDGSSWVDNGSAAGFTAVRNGAIQGSNATAVSPLTGRYVGFAQDAGFNVLGEYAYLGAGTKTRLFDIKLKAGSSLTNFDVQGDAANEVGLQLLADGTTPSSGSFFLGAKDGNFGDAALTYQGGKYSVIATPEPGTIGALAIGALAVLRRRNKKA